VCCAARLQRHAKAMHPHAKTPPACKPPMQAPLHKDADLELGGLACNDDKLLQEMRE